MPHLLRAKHLTSKFQEIENTAVFADSGLAEENDAVAFTGAPEKSVSSA
ncbi:MAG: hypothetical protein AAB650_02510 [Patescibacteria group bacterium]